MGGPLEAITRFLEGGHGKRRSVGIYIPIPGYIEAMDFSETELAQVIQLIKHVFFGLQSDNLIAEWFQTRPQDDGLYREKIWSNATARGTELLLWAFGHGDKPLEFIFDADFFPTIEGVPKQFRNAHCTMAAPVVDLRAPNP